MYARSTEIQGRPESIDAGIAYLRDDVMQAVQSMDGCIGMSMLVDRTSGRCIATTAWQSENAMRASKEQLQPVREQAGQILGGSPQVDEWEIAVLHRDHKSVDAACVRVTWMRIDPAELDRAIDVYKLATMPAAEDLEGFCSASLFVDRASGRCVSSVTYDSRDAMERNREGAAELRTAGAEDAQAEVLDVCEFELALAHLRVPEMA